MVITVKPKAAKAAPIVREGTYDAELTGVSQFSNAYGPRIGFEFTIQGGDYNGVQLLRSTAPQLSAKSRLADVLSGLLGRELTESELMGGMDVEALIGTRCRVLVLTGRNRSGGVFSNIERIFK